MRTDELINYIMQRGELPPGEGITLEVQGMLVGTTKLLGTEGVRDSYMLVMLGEDDANDTRAYVYFPSAEALRCLAIGIIQVLGSIE